MNAQTPKNVPEVFSFHGKDTDTSELKPIKADLSKRRPTLKTPERFKDYVLGKTAGT